jgi:hypothetical protein
MKRPLETEAEAFPMGAGASKAQKKSQRAAELALAYNWESLEDWAHRCALERERAAAARAQTEEMEAAFADAPMPSAAAAAAAGTAAAAAAIPPDSPSRSLSGETGERLQAYREQRAAEGRPVSSSSLFPPPVIARVFSSSSSSAHARTLPLLRIPRVSSCAWIHAHDMLSGAWCIHRN